MLLFEIPLVLSTGSGLKRVGARGLLGVGVLVGGLRWLLCALITDTTLLFAVQALHGVTVVGLNLGSPLYLDVVARADRIATPGNWEILSVKAQALAHLGDSKRAVATIKQALRIAPNNPQLACAAAVVYTLAGDDDESALRYARLAEPGALENPFLNRLRKNPAFPKLINGPAA